MVLRNTEQYTEHLMVRLTVQPGEEVDLLSPVNLRRYIAYARRYVHPKLGVEAKHVLGEYYRQLRTEPPSESSPITTLQLESLIRLTEARARLELREEVMPEDAVEVVTIVQASRDSARPLDFSQMSPPPASPSSPCGSSGQNEGSQSR